MSKKNMRFVENLDERVSELCDDLDVFEIERVRINGEYTEGVHLIVPDGKPRISIARSIWETDGFPLTELSAKLLQ